MSNTGLIVDNVGQNYVPYGVAVPAVAPTLAETGDTAAEFRAVVPHATTTQNIEIRFRVARLTSIYLSSTKTITLLNGTDTVTVTANVAKVWVAGGGTCPFTVDTGIADASRLQITVPAGGGTSADDATVYFRFLQAPA